MSARKVFEAIVYVLRTSIQWRALPKERFGAPSAIHRYFLEMQRTLREELELREGPNGLKHGHLSDAIAALRIRFGGGLASSYVPGQPPRTPARAVP